MEPHIILGEGLFLKLAQKIIWFSQLIEFVKNASYYDGHKQTDNRFAFSFASSDCVDILVAINGCQIKAETHYSFWNNHKITWVLNIKRQI